MHRGSVVLFYGSPWDDLTQELNCVGMSVANITYDTTMSAAVPLFLLGQPVRLGLRSPASLPCRAAASDGARTHIHATLRTYCIRHVCIYIYIYYKYIYIYRERERYMYMYICMYTYTLLCNIIIVFCIL